MSDVHNHYTENDFQPVQIRGSRNVSIIEWFLLLFVAFKLAHIIAWSWIFVLMPLWIPALSAMFMTFVGRAVKAAFMKRMRNRW